MKEFTLSDFKRTIAHEWGHYIACDLLGYGKYNEGMTFKIDISGMYGRTTNFAMLSEDVVSRSDELVILYAGSVADSLFSGKDVHIAYTDADKAKKLASSRKELTMARKKAYEILLPYSNAIKELVALTLNRYSGIDQIINRYNKASAFDSSFDDRVFKDEALELFKKVKLCQESH